MLTYVCFYRQRLFDESTITCVCFVSDAKHRRECSLDCVFAHCVHFESTLMRFTRPPSLSSNSSVFPCSLNANATGCFYTHASILLRPMSHSLTEHRPCTRAHSALLSLRAVHNTTSSPESQRARRNLSIERNYVITGGDLSIPLVTTRFLFRRLVELYTHLFILHDIQAPPDTFSSHTRQNIE